MGTLSVDATQVRNVVARFYEAFLAADREALRDVVAPETAWIVPLETALSGAHRGPDGIADLRRRLSVLTDDTWRPLRHDSVDVTASPWHGVLLDRYLADRHGRRLDSHEGIVAAVEDGRIVRLFHYLHDPAGFAAFWSTAEPAKHAS